MSGIPNVLKNEGIAKISFTPIAEGSRWENMFARYEKTTSYNDGSHETALVERMAGEHELGKFGFFYAGKIANSFVYKYDGRNRQQIVRKLEVNF